LEPEIFKRVQDFFNRGKIKKKQKVLLITTFVLIATFLWFLNILSEEHSTTIKFPVRYSNFPPDKVLINTPTSYLSLSIKAKGFKILQHNFSLSPKPVNLDYYSFQSNQMPNTEKDKRFILTSDIKNKLIEQLEEFEIEWISPDSLKFEFDNENSKKVKVIPDITFDLETNIMIAGAITSDPDSIIISGPESLLDTINVILTEPHEFKRLKKSVQKNLQLINPHENVTISNNEVDVLIPVEKFTEKELNIPIEAENLPEGLIIRTFPGSIRLIFNVIWSEFDKYLPDHFRAVVDYNSIEQNNENVLKVKIVKSPENIFLKGFSPSNVEYIIEK